MNILIVVQHAGHLNIIGEFYLSQVSEDVLCDLINHDLVSNMYFETADIL